jgi:undecaprenyl-diphosphatase
MDCGIVPARRLSYNARAMTQATAEPGHHITPSDMPAWKLAWLTPARCRILLALVLLLDILGHVRYLNHNCPIDLSGDEAQYWDWSRQLDWSYYSKGPLVALIIRASCTIFGDTMQGVRYPAIAFAAGTSIVTYLLTRKLFASERLALGAVLLNHLVPMFVAGSVLMTIDPPMFFCWALATYFAAVAIFDDRPIFWALVGFAVGVGFLAKYAAMLWFGGLALFFLLEPVRFGGQKRNVTLALVLALLLTLPVVFWNIRHGGASLKHVAHQTGASGGALSRGNLGEFIGSQILVVGPILAVMMGFAVVHAFKTNSPERPKLIFLTSIGLSFFALTLLSSIVAKVQVNWPAPAYFTLMILTAHWLGTRLQSAQTWRPWRGWFWATVVFGVIVTPIAHDPGLVLPTMARISGSLPKRLRFDAGGLVTKLVGWKRLGDHVSDQLDRLGAGAMVLCDDYMQTAETAFYVRGQPRTYYAGSYYGDAKRMTQYDMWPDRRLDAAGLLGRNVVYVGKGGPVPPDIERAFDRIERLPEVPIVVRGVTVRTFKMWIGYNFKGMNRPTAPATY